MPTLSRYVVLSLVVILAFTASLSAQTNEPRLTIKVPLRADEIVVDAENDRVLLRGSIDWPDGRTTTSVEIRCWSKARMLAVTDRDFMTDDRWGDIDPDFCNQLARVQRRK